MLNSYMNWFESNRASLLEDFFNFLRFPSISTDPAYQSDLFACKSWLVSYMRSIGLDVEVWETSGAPVVFGSYASQEGPILLFYGHYDVQPAAPLEEWKSPPFEPQMRDGIIYARGAVDNKGQAFYTLLAIRAFIEIAKQKNIVIKVVIEGEEEIGSRGLESVLQERREELRADHLFIVDVDMYARGIPAITLGTRGVVSLNVTVANSFFDLHSGMYGGIVLSPVKALVQALAILWEANGRVAIPEFYENVLPLSREEKEGLDWEGDFQKEAALLGIKVCQSEEGFSFLESNWIRPNLEINGIESGYTGKGFKTIIPSRAMVKLSCRLVPGQDPSHILSLIETFFKNNLPKEMEISFERGAQALAVRTSSTSETVKCVAKAYERVYKTRCLRKLCGGSIPIAPSLSKVCGAEPVMIGVGLAEDQVHAPNECFSFDRLKEGFLSITQLLEIFANGEKNALEGSRF